MSDNRRVESREPQEDERVARAARGDHDALEELLHEHVPGVRSALSIAPRWRRSLDIEDVLQVTYLEVFLRIGSLQARTAAGFRAWLHRIAENNLRDAVRGLGRSKRPEAHGRVTHGAEGESARTLLASLAGDGSTAGTQIAGRESLEELRRALGRLPGTYRDVIQALDLDERPVREVAGEFGRSTGALHMLRSRALDRLRELLGT